MEMTIIMIVPASYCCTCPVVLAVTIDHFKIIFLLLSLIFTGVTRV